jgi:hypothetical protein
LPAGAAGNIFGYMVLEFNFWEGMSYGKASCCTE